MNVTDFRSATQVVYGENLKKTKQNKTTTTTTTTKQIYGCLRKTFFESAEECCIKNVT